MKTKYSTKENERQKYKQNILNEKKLRSLLNLKMAVSGLSWESSDVKQGQLSLQL